MISSFAFLILLFGVIFVLSRIEFSASRPAT